MSIKYHKSSELFLSSVTYLLVTLSYGLSRAMFLKGFGLKFPVENNFEIQSQSRAKQNWHQLLFQKYKIRILYGSSINDTLQHYSWEGIKDFVTKVGNWYLSFKKHDEWRWVSKWIKNSVTSFIDDTYATIKFEILFASNWISVPSMINHKNPWQLSTTDLMRFFHLKILCRTEQNDDGSWFEDEEQTMKKKCDFIISAFGSTFASTEIKAIIQ